MEFKGLLPLSLIEYPGEVVAVVHTGGCNFRCPFCYNRDLVLNPGSLPTVTEDEVLGLLKRRRKWLDGLAISGGEPTIHADLPEFVGRVKELGFLVLLETNGSNPEMLRELIDRGLVDCIALDIKAPLTWKQYSRAIGKRDEGLFRNVLKSIELLKRGKVDYEFRTTLVPTLLTERDVMTIAEQLRGAKRYILQQFIPRTTVDREFERLKPWPLGRIEKLGEKIKGLFERFDLRNI